MYEYVWAPNLAKSDSLRGPYDPVAYFPNFYTLLYIVFNSYVIQVCRSGC